MNDKIRIGFIFGDGTFFDDGNTHVEIANAYIEEQGLQEKFSKSKYDFPIDFLIMKLGAIKVGNLYEDKVISFKERLMTEKQFEYINQFYGLGYKIDIL